MKKGLIFAAAIALFSSASYAEGTPVSDQAVLTQIQDFEQKLLQKLEQQSVAQSSSANPFNCTDGERSFSPGFKLTVNGQKYRCEAVNGHGEWKEILTFQ